MDRIDRDTPDRSHALALTTEQEHAMAVYDGSHQSLLNDTDEGIDLREYWRIIMARKGTILLVTLVVVIATLISTSLETPLYVATAKIKIDQQADQIIQFQTNVGSGYGSGGFMSTQLQLLKSKSLAIKVVDQLGLGLDRLTTPEKAEASFFDGLMESVRGLMGEKEKPKPAAVKSTVRSEVDIDARNSRLAGALAGGIKVKQVGDSSIVEVSYVSADNKLTAKVVNAVIEEYIQSNLERDYKSSSYAKEFLDERIKKVRANLEESEAKLVAYAQELGMVDLESAQGTKLEKVSGLNALLTQAEANRYKAEAEFQQLNAEGGANSIYVLENPVVQTYKQQMVLLETEYQKKLKVFKPGYPEMVQMKSEMDEIRKNITKEVGNLKNAVGAKYRAAVAEEAMLRARLLGVKTEVMETLGQSTSYQTLKRDVDTNRELYDGLLQRLKEVDIVAGSGSSAISVVDAAEVPGWAFKPNLRANLKMALILGLLGGIGLAFLFDYLDDTVKSPSDLEKISRLAVLGLVPEMDEDIEESVGMMSALDPTSAIAEAYRSIRTSLSFSTATGAPDILHFTSCSAGEGKTTSAMNLAIAYTQAGSNILLIDADLRNPSLHQEFVIPNDMGLTNYLAGEHTPSQVIQKTKIQNLWILPTGPIPPNPAELLSSGKMLDLVTSAAKRFDMVIIDSPPVLGLADALVLANMAKATILIVDAGATRKAAVEGSLQRLRRSRANVIGAILTKHSDVGARYSHDYNYSYSYGASEDGDDPRGQYAS